MRVVSSEILRDLANTARDWLGEDVDTLARDLREPIPPIYPEEEALVASAVDKRKREFAHGRDLVRALSAQRSVAPQPILRTSEGRPLWPTGSWASITHTDEVAMAAVGPPSPTFGIDLEGAEPLLDGTLHLILHPQELADYGRDPMHGKRVFSAKEAFYKAQHVHTDMRLGFREVSLDWSGDDFSVAIHRTEARIRLPGPVQGSVATIGPFLLSACWFSQ